MARNNVRLINYHTSGTTAPKKTDMAVGEIAVGKDLIWSKHKENEELSVFISSGAVHSAITAAETTLKGITDSLSTAISANTKEFEKYATSANTVAADEKVLSSAKTYTDLLKAKEGETYSGETLAGLKSEINSLKGDSTTTVGALASRVTTAEGKITALETTVGNSTSGLVKDVADLKTKFDSYATSADTVAADTKTLNDAKSYTDSQIKAIKGGDGTTTETISSLNGKIKANSSAISGIKNSEKLNNFKDVEDEINLKISSVYKVRGTKATYAELPTEGNNVGDVYNVTAANGNTPAGTNYVCTATAGTRDEQWDALGGTIDLSGYVSASSFNTLEQTVTGHTTDITNLKKSASTLNTDVQTIKGWKINDKFISGSPILNGTDIKVDDTPDAQTLNVAIASAKTAGDNAMIYAQGVSGSVKALTDEVNKNKAAIDAYTVNGIKISEKPVLTGENVRVSTATTAQTLNKAIDDAKAAGTAAQNNLDALKGTYSGTLDTLSNKVDANGESITTINGTLATASSRANSAIQKITIKANADAGVKISDPKGNDGEKTQELDFSAIVIDCGEF